MFEFKRGGQWTEEKMLGKTTDDTWEHANWDNEKEIERLKEANYERYPNLAEYVKDIQPPESTPTSPPTEFSQHLREAIIARLKGDVEINIEGISHSLTAEHNIRNMDELEYYTAVRSSLDVIHGTDAFYNFEVDPYQESTFGSTHEYDGGVLTIALDLKTDEVKYATLKDDLDRGSQIIYAPSGGVFINKDKEEFDKCIGEAADYMVRKISKDIEQFRNKQKAERLRGSNSRKKRKRKKRG